MKKRLTLKTCSCRHKTKRACKPCAIPLMRTYTDNKRAYIAFLQCIACFFHCLISHLVCFFLHCRFILYCCTHRIHTYMALIIQTKWLRYFYARSVLANYFYLPMNLQNSLQKILYCYDYQSQCKRCSLPFFAFHSKTQPCTSNWALKKAWNQMNREGEWNLVTTHRQ